MTNQVRLAWWGAEVDMDGSTHYVETSLRADRRKIALYLNLDMVASPNVAGGGQGGCDEDAADGSTKVARVGGAADATGVTPRSSSSCATRTTCRSWTPASRRAGLSQAATRKDPQAGSALGRASGRGLRSLLPRSMRRDGQH